MSIQRPEEEECLLEATPTKIKTPNLKTEFRSEIQGLRAVAILSVLLFHMWSDLFKFGFLGVDM
jgi:peptidoglycan/LPS O-acetylase OafA/YrhL